MKHYFQLEIGVVMEKDIKSDVSMQSDAIKTKSNSQKQPLSANDEKKINDVKTDKNLNVEVNVSKTDSKRESGSKTVKPEKSDASTVNEKPKPQIAEQVQDAFQQMKTGYEKMSQGVEKLKLPDYRLIYAIGLVVIGLLFCIFRTSMISILLTVVGIVLIVVALYAALKRKYVLAAVEGIIGIVIIACGWTVLDISLLILGLIFIGFSVMELIENAHDFKSKSGTAKALSIINPILLLVFGILLVVSKWVLTDAICIVIGVIAAVDGILMIVKDGVKKRG